SLPNEKELAESAGLEYVNIPVTGCHALTPAKVREVNAEVDFEEDGKTLVYCASGNRASSWLAAHLFHDCGLSPEEAVLKAQQVGMDMPHMASETIKLLKSAQ
ncbi:MAG: hypothetical protein KDD50_16325, partial [Bdellovibrionales bacterium]|nr:hypothetical protein [Bdellovibrionales bacterium]